MAKQNITASNVDVNNIQSLPDLVVGQATSLKQTFDKTGADTQTYINDTLIPELNGDDGAFKIGLTNPELLSNNVGDGITEVLQVAKDAQAGTIIDGSIEDVKLSNAPGQIKEKVSTLETDVSTLETDVSTLETDLNIIRTAVLDTGTVNNIIVDTSGTFDLTRNGNILTVIPLFTNTSATVNISADAQTNKLIKKANDSGTLVALEVGDIKKNVPCQLVWDSVNDFFIFAPKGGSNIKSIQRGSVSYNTTSLVVAISGVDIGKSIIKISEKLNGANFISATLISVKFQDSTHIVFQTYDASPTAVSLEWEVIEFNNVKSKQSGSVSLTNEQVSNITVSTINSLKATVFSTMRLSFASTTQYDYTLHNNKIISATSIQFNRFSNNSNVPAVIEWQLIEFN